MSFESKRWLVGLLIVAALLRGWLLQHEPRPGFYYDERFNVENLVHLLTTGGPEPKNAIYPAFSYLPLLPFVALVDALAAWLGVGAIDPIHERTFMPAGYLLCRSLQTLLGLASIVFTYFAGRHLAGPRGALLAAFLLSVVPWHVRQSVVIKPDIAVLAWSTLALWLALRAAERPSWGRYLAAGAAVGLAVGTKYTALPIAVPLAIAALCRLRHEPRVLARLAAAAVVSVGVFLATNPFLLLAPELYRRDVGITARDYERKGLEHGITHLDVLASSAQTLVSPLFHGPVLGTFALLSLAALALSAVRMRARGEPATPRWMICAFPPAQAGFYATLTTNPEAWHNWLLITPATSLAAAWGLGELARGRGASWPRLQRPWLLGPLLAIGVFLAAFPALRFAYELRVPTTSKRATHHVLRRLKGPLPARHLIQENGTEPIRNPGTGKTPPIEWVEDLTQLDPQTRRRADVEVRRATGRPLWRSSAYERFEPRWLELRGPALEVAFHPWEVAGPAAEVPLVEQAPGSGVLVAQLAPIGAQELISFRLWVSFGADPTALPSLELDQRPLRLFIDRKTSAGDLYLSERVELEGAGKLTLELPARGQAAEPLEGSIELYRWQRRRPQPSDNR